MRPIDRMENGIINASLQCCTISAVHPCLPVNPAQALTCQLILVAAKQQVHTIHKKLLLRSNIGICQGAPNTSINCQEIESSPFVSLQACGPRDPYQKPQGLSDGFCPGRQTAGQLCGGCLARGTPCGSAPLHMPCPKPPRSGDETSSQ